MKKRGLGRGLDALLGGGTMATAASPAAPQNLPIAAIAPGAFQPRRRFDSASLDSLAESIKSRGIIQPLVVRPKKDGGGFEIVAGERRWQAAERAGLKSVPAIVREMSDREALCCALVENLQREDLSAIEQARGIARLIAEFHLSHEKAAAALGCARPTVSNLLRLLELAPAAQDLLGEGKIEMGHARALLALPTTAQAATARQVAASGLTVRQTESLAKKIRQGDSKRPRAAVIDADAARMADSLSRRLGARVEIKPRGKQAGRLVIHYGSSETLERIAAKLK